MSNEETLQEYNTRLVENNTSLDDILTTVKNLPGSSGGGSSNIYSTEETVIGTWLGKPLYRKVYEFDVEAKTNGTFTKSELGISETDHITINIGSSGALYYNAAKTKNGFSPISYYVSSTDRSHVYVNMDKNLIIQNQSETPRKYYIVLEYTKKTD